MRAVLPVRSKLVEESMRFTPVVAGDCAAAAATAGVDGNRVDRVPRRGSPVVGVALMPSLTEIRSQTNSGRLGASFALSQFCWDYEKKFDMEIDK